MKPKSWLPLTMLSLGFCLGLGCGTVACGADVDSHDQLVDPALQARFESITKQLRCLVCQNESIADSNAQLAGDLRREVREQLLAGSSDAQIFDFMTARYGEFVRFNTPLEGKTLAIWGAPFLLLVVGGVVIFRVTRARARLPLDDEPTPGSPEPGHQ